jgi:hypothetical protein
MADGLRFVALTPEIFRMMPLPADLTGPGTLMGTPGAVEAAARSGYALALLDGGRIVAAGGLLPIWAGRGLCWFMPSIWMELRHYARVLHRCRRELVRLQAEGFRRIDCTVGTTKAPAIRWAERLGFKCEGTLLRYGPSGEDHFMMRWENPHG